MDIILLINIVVERNTNGIPYTHIHSGISTWLLHIASNQVSKVLLYAGGYNDSRPYRGRGTV